MAESGPVDRYRFAYDPPVIRSGPDCVADLGAELERAGLERALVVSGTTVGTTPAVIDPVRSGLGDRLDGVFAETTPAKRFETAVRAAERATELGADALVGLGGGSSLDVATVASVVAASDRSPRALGREIETSGTLPVPDGPLVPVVAVPTTLAGADLSTAAGFTTDGESDLVDRAVSGGVSDGRLMPHAVAVDPSLVATTPRRILAASAMNGFDKGLETLYAATATPVTDATATHGLSLLRYALPALGSDPDLDQLQTIVDGIVLVQYGISRAEGSTLSLVHAFGHALSRPYDVQQGAAHAVIAPHVLEYLFDAVDGRRALLAAALGASEAIDPAQAVVDAVTEVRDALGLPSRLRDVDGPGPEELEAVAGAVLEDPLLANAPPALASPTRADIEGVLQAAW